MIGEIIDHKRLIEFGNFLKKETDFLFNYKTIMGNLYGVEIWPSEKELEYKISNISKKEKNIIEFFLFCGHIKINELECAIGKENVKLLLKIGYARQKNGIVSADNYVIVPVLDNLILVNSPYANDKTGHEKTELYIGSDTLRLIHFVENKTNAHILDMCSGSGAVGISLSKNVERVDFVEKNEHAICALKFNLLINSIELNKINIYKSDLFKAVPEKNMTILYAIRHSFLHQKTWICRCVVMVVKQGWTW